MRSKIVRIFQLTLVAIIFMTIAGLGTAVLEWILPGTMDRFNEVGDSEDWLGDIRILELAMIPIFSGIYASCFAIEKLRLRRVSNEIEVSLKPLRMALKGYLLFLVPVCAVIYCILQDWKLGILHFILGLIGFFSFMRKEQKKEKLKFSRIRDSQS